MELFAPSGPGSRAGNTAFMNTLLENNLPSLDSLDLAGAVDFVSRLDALEDTVNTFTERLECDVLTRIRSLEDALTNLIVSSRRDLAVEATQRNEQLASLAGKVSKKIDAMHLTAIAFEEKQLIISKQVQTGLEDRIAETRAQIAEEANELRTVLRAKLDALSGESR